LIVASADRIIELLYQARARPAGAERERFLAEACGDDATLKDQIVSLLKADADEGDSDFLKNTQLLRPTAPVTEKPGDRIGRYKLLQQIGEGGCGVVYMAEQEEPVRRRVALKVIKLGMDTKQVIARFEAERQALAMMDHPNIAKVLDAGATDTGRPFFVMELVRGIKITDYCDQNNLSTNERLELFIQVCQAIQHAHQKGIIHRDIKPSNILVTHHDHVAVPKVIDFGIAKATIGQLTDKTVFTAFTQFVGTPAYMSPEQAQMSGLDIDTRADIYSLGVLLYELLTGNTPFDAKELLAAGMDEMRRKIREDEPAKPSTRLSTMLAMDLTAVAKNRHVEPPRLIHLIRGDLDWLVMKCLEKDRTRRYETANGLAMDLQRHLDDEPVIARPPSTAYRFQKLVRRNKLAFAAAAAVLLVLLGGIAASTWQAIRAKNAEHEQTRLRKEAEKAWNNEAKMRQQAEASREKSETEAAKAIAISDFLQQLLRLQRSASPEPLKGSQYTVRLLLDDFSAGLTNRLKDQPEVEAAVRASIGRAYYRLGVPDKPREQFERALTLRRRIFGDQAEPVAESLVDYTWTFVEQGPGPAAKGEPYVREALEIYRKRGTAGQPVIYALWTLQKVLATQGRYAEAEAVVEQALSLGQNPQAHEFPELASMIHGLAEIKNRQSQYAEAEVLARKAVEMHRRLSGAEHSETAWGLLALGIALRGQQKLTEAEATLREALQIFRTYYYSGHFSVNLAMGELKLVLEARGDSAGLEALARRQLDEADERIERNNAEPEAWIQRAIAHTDLNMREAAMEDWAKASARSPNNAKLRMRIAELYRGQGKWGEAERVLREALALHRKQLGDVHREVDNALASLARVLRQEGKLAEAEAVRREELAVERKLSGDENPFVATSLAELTSILLAEKQFAEAEPTARECLTIRELELPDEWRTFNARSLLGESLLGQKKFAEAEPLLVSGYEGMKQREDTIPDVGKPRLRESLQRLVQLYETTDQSEKAAEWNKKLAEFDQALAARKTSVSKP